MSFLLRSSDPAPMDIGKGKSQKDAGEKLREELLREIDRLKVDNKEKLHQARIESKEDLTKAIKDESRKLQDIQKDDRKKLQDTLKAEFAQDLHKTGDSFNRELSIMKDSFNRELSAMRESVNHDLTSKTDFFTQQLHNAKSDHKADIQKVKGDLEEIKRSLEAKNDRTAERLAKVIEFLNEAEKKEEVPDGPTDLSIPVIVFSEAEGIAAGLHAGLPREVAPYFQFKETPLRSGFPGEAFDVAVVTLYAPTDRWLDLMGKPLIDQFKERYPKLVLILMKPFSDPSKLKSISQTNGFDFAFQVCCSNDLRVLPNEYNKNEIASVSTTLKALFANRITEVEQTKRARAEKSKQLKALSKLA